MKKFYSTFQLKTLVLSLCALFIFSLSVSQVQAQASGTGFQNEDGTYDGVFELEPFEVTASQDDGMQYEYTTDDYFYTYDDYTYDDYTVIDIWSDPVTYDPVYIYDETGDWGDSVSVASTNTTTDYCPNISGTQASVPDGMYVDENGYCVAYPSDVCPNISGTQETVPQNYAVDSNGDCVDMTTTTVVVSNDSAPVGNLDSATCSTVSGWTYDPDTSPTTTYVPPSTSATACWQTPSAVEIDGYRRCQQSGACTAGGTADSKCLDADGNMEQPPGRDYCVAVDSLDDADCNRPVPYTPTTSNTLSCTASINEPADALGISGMLGGSRVKGDQASADFACQQLGYNSATSFQTKGFSSCGDNGLAYANGGSWSYGNACTLGNSGIYWLQCAGTGAICQNMCGNGVVDSGEQCDGNVSTRQNRCGEPTWYCSRSCTMVSENLDRGTLCP
jgi:hypothetical protein